MEELSKIFSAESGFSHFLWGEFLLPLLMTLAASFITWLKLDERFRKKKVALLICMCWFVLSSAFLWAIHSIGGENKALPNFKPTISFINVAQMMRTDKQLEDDPVVIFLKVQAVNRGSPSILGDWRLTVILPSGSELKAKLLPPPLRDVHFMSEHGGPDVIVTPDDWIEPKCRTEPVPRGKMVEGFLEFLVPNVQRSLITSSGAKLRVNVTDSDEKVYSVENTFPGQLTAY